VVFSDRILTRRDAIWRISRAGPWLASRQFLERSALLHLAPPKVNAAVRRPREAAKGHCFSQGADVLAKQVSRRRHH
jgi:hypothetical protein